VLRAAQGAHGLREDRRAGPVGGQVWRSELLRQSCLLGHAVGGVSRQDLVVDREGCSTARGVQDVVVAVAVAYEHAASFL